MVLLLERALTFFYGENRGKKSQHENNNDVMAVDMTIAIGYYPR